VATKVLEACRVLTRNSNVTVTHIEDEIEKRSTEDLRYYLEHGCWPEAVVMPNDGGDKPT